MKVITIVQEYTIPLPKEYTDISKEKLVDNLNRMYDIHGQNIINTMSAENDYQGTTLVRIDNESVYVEDCPGGQKICESGYDIILDGQPLIAED